MELAYFVLCTSGCKVVYYQDGILGEERQLLQGVCCGRPRAREVRSSHALTEMLLCESSQLRFEHPRATHEVQRDVGASKNGSVDRPQQRCRDTQRRIGGDSKALPNASGQRFIVWQCGQGVPGQW